MHPPCWILSCVNILGRIIHPWRPPPPPPRFSNHFLFFIFFSFLHYYGNLPAGVLYWYLLPPPPVPTAVCSRAEHTLLRGIDRVSNGRGAELNSPRIHSTRIRAGVWNEIYFFIKTRTTPRVRPIWNCRVMMSFAVGNIAVLVYAARY